MVNEIEYSYALMTVAVAREITGEWKCQVPWDFYGITADPEDYEEFVTVAQWSNFYTGAASW